MNNLGCIRVFVCALSVFHLPVKILAGPPSTNSHEIQQGAFQYPDRGQSNVFIMKLDDGSRSALEAKSESSGSKFLWLVLGAIISSVAGLLGTFYSHRLQTKEKKREADEFVINTIRSIQCELEGAQNVYRHGIGALLNELPKDKPFRYRLALTQDWFSVFNANAGHFGRLPSPLATQIITVYILMKKMIEEFRINNAYLDELDKIESGTFRDNKADEFKRYEIVLMRLMEEAVRLKLAEADLNIAIAKLFRQFNDLDLVKPNV